VEHLSTFGLTRDPFANEPQLDLFFESASARDVSARLRRAAQQSKGLVVLTAAGGLGKTMLVRHLLEGLEEELFEACLLVPVPGVSDGSWVIDRLARQLGVEKPAADRASALSELYERLAIVREDGRHCVVILDEAQVLAEQGALRELRGLLNLEYEEKRLVTLVLVGLPSLAHAVAAEPALAERVDVPLRLAGLTPDESARYLTHRIRAAGGNPAILESGAVTALVKWSAGVARRLNRLADAALFEAHLAGRVSATAADVERAAAELELPQPEGHVAPPPAPAAKEEPRRSAPPARNVAPPPGPAAVVQRRAPPAPALAAAPAPAPALAPPAARDAKPNDLEAIFADDETAFELEEVVATNTDPLRGQPAATVALLGDDAAFDDAFGRAVGPDTTDAFFERREPVAVRPAAPNGDESSADLDDLFADLVKE
jgi:type II secretory pathway predicted ATPase ExeA